MAFERVERACGGAYRVYGALHLSSFPYPRAPSRQRCVDDPCGVAFDVASRGNVHFRPQGVRGRGKGHARGQGNDGGVVRYVSMSLLTLVTPQAPSFRSYSLRCGVPCSVVGYYTRDVFSFFSWSLTRRRLSLVWSPVV